MKSYIGTKIVNALPMTRQAYNDFRGWTLPLHENGSDEGFLVEHPNEKPNSEEYKGYVSWSPKDNFNSAYKQLGNLTFGDAIHSLKQGYKLARKGWNGKGMFIFLVPSSEFKVNRKPLLGIYEEGTEIKYQSHIDMKTEDNTVVPWLSSQTDMLAEDWSIV